MVSILLYLQHEKERHTTGGWGLTTVALLVSICLLLWQNMDTIFVPLIKIVSTHLPEIRYALFRYMHEA